MSYAQYSRIDSVDYNSFAVTSLNTLTGVGNGTFGYGQSAIPYLQFPALAEKFPNDQIRAVNEWNQLINYITALAAHQGTTIVPITAPTTDNLIQFYSNLQNNINLITNNRLNAANSGITTNNTPNLFNGKWTTNYSVTFTISFYSSNAARYFFNAGGQVAVNFLQGSSGYGFDNLLTQLALSTGTILLSSPSSGTISIGGNPYTGVSRIGGSGTGSINLNNGYYALTTTPTQIWQKISPSNAGTAVTIFASSNGTTGSNGDKGSAIYIKVMLTVPQGVVINAQPTYGTLIRCRLFNPSTTYLAPSWGQSGTGNGITIGTSRFYYPA